MEKYYYADGYDHFGPYSLEELLRRGITAETLVWHEGMKHWQKARFVPELQDLLISKHNNPTSTASPSKETSKSSFSKPPFFSRNKPTSETPKRRPSPKSTPSIENPKQGKQGELFPSTTPRMPAKTWVLESILMTVVCCVPIGLIGIIYSSQITQLNKSGEYEEAQKKSESVKKLMNVGIIIWVIIIVLIVLLALFED